VQVTTKIDDRQVKRMLDTFERRQMPFAVSLALNRTAQTIARLERAEMRRRFDRPTPYTLNALRVVPAKKTSLTARVWFKDFAGKGTVAEDYLLPQVEGGTRSQKRFERALRRIGIMTENEFAVPGAGAKLDAYGNMGRGQIVQILAYLQAFGEQGYRANMDAKGRARLARTTKKRRGVEYFVSRGPGTWTGARSWKNGRAQHLPRGIYQRTSFAFGKAIKPVVLFVPRATYRPRFDFHGVANQVVHRDLLTELRKAMAEATRTAR